MMTKPRVALVWIDDPRHSTSHRSNSIPAPASISGGGGAVAAAAAAASSSSSSRGHQIRYPSDSLLPVTTIMEGVEAPTDLHAFHSSAASSTTDADEYATSQDGSNGFSNDDAIPSRHYASGGRASYDSRGTPLTNFSSYEWTPNSSVNSRASKMSSTIMTPGASTISSNASMRSGRPPNTRQQSNAYAPARRPHQYSINTPVRPRDTSIHRSRDPNAEYRAQERRYVQQIRQDEAENGIYSEPRTPSLDYSSASDSENESPSVHVDQDSMDVDTFLYYGNEDIEPSIEQLKIPENRERLEWHGMLANVLTGDVVKQEKKRLIGGGEQQGGSLQTEVWLGVRAKTCGRSIGIQKQLIEDGRAKVKQEIESIVSFEINGEAETGKSPLEQVKEVVKRIEKIEGLYPTRQAFENAHPRGASAAYKDTCDAIIAWHNTTELINTELAVLQKWVGNPELDFTAPRVRPEDEKGNHLFDDSSFIDRILKEDGLKSLHSKSLRSSKSDDSDYSLMDRVNMVILKAKATLISNSGAFAELHLPPYIEELLTLINFASRLIQEIIRIRLSYAKKMKGTIKQQGVMTYEQMIPQFRVLLQLAVKIKESYTIIAQPEPGWDLPPCIDENFDSVVIDALKYYFKMLKLKLAAHKNTFKEAEILEQEWDFSNELGRCLEGGDIEVAEQFSNLTFHSMDRLAKNFQAELRNPPDEASGAAEVDKRYKALLDSVRVRQRKIFRFNRILSQRFENATEYSLAIDHDQMEHLLLALRLSGHFLVETPTTGSRASSSERNPSKIYVIASPTLRDRPRDVENMLGTCYHPEDALEDPSDPYVLLLRSNLPLSWEGGVMETTLGVLDLKPSKEPRPIKLVPGRLRLVADGSLERLQKANFAFHSVLGGLELQAMVEQRANLNQIDSELQNIRRSAHELSNTIMESVAIVRSQIAAVGRQYKSQELTQTCFAFATEFGQRSAIYMDSRRRALNQVKLTKLALDWISFICDDCVPNDRKTFRWAVVALEFAMVMTRGQNILSISEADYALLRNKVAGCMSLLISHFDIMGARGSVAAQAASKITDAIFNKTRMDLGTLKDDEESSTIVRLQRFDELEKVEQNLLDREAERRALGRVLEDSNDADRALTHLSASAGNVHLRWQQGQFVGGGTFGSVYAAIDLDSGHMMAVKEIRLQDPKMIPTVVMQIRDEMGVLQVLDHPNIVQYYGIEPHRDKVYIFMEYCSGGSLATLLEQGRIEDEMVLQVFTLQLLEGLGYLHQANVVHRDIKPDNILLDHNSVIKYVDFGAAKVIARQGRTVVAGAPGGGANNGRQRSMQGTPMYMSPEVIKGERQRNARLGAEDIWSLGCVINEMATGVRPWANLDNEFAIMYKIADGNSPQMPTPDQMSDLGLDFLKRCFECDPARRASAAELLQHEWMQSIMVQHSLVPTTPQTPASETAFASLSARQSTSSQES